MPLKSISRFSVQQAGYSHFSVMMEVQANRPNDFVEQAAEMSRSFVADDEEEDEEIEPKLKYERLSNDIAHILKNDAASCIAVHPKVSNCLCYFVLTLICSCSSCV